MQDKCMFCEDLRADGVTLTEAHKADLSAVNVVAQTSILRSSNTKGVLMTEHAKYPLFPDNIHFWYETPNARLEQVATAPASAAR
jgi:hypothetical protein